VKRNLFTLQIHCNYIFVLDDIIETERISNLKLLIFNLKNDTLVKPIYISFDVATNQTGAGLLIEPMVYIPDECTQFLGKIFVSVFSFQYIYSIFIIFIIVHIFV